MKTALKLTIGRLAEKSGVGVETVRFYERKGLIDRPRNKMSSGYREYLDQDIQKIEFIKKAQNLGFSLKEIKELLELKGKKKISCEKIRKKSLSKIEEIEKKIKTLKAMKEKLSHLCIACDNGPEAVACCDPMQCFNGQCNCAA